MDSILKAPLGGGLTLTRIVHPNSDVTIAVTAADGAERFNEAITRRGRPPVEGEPADAEQSRS